MFPVAETTQNHAYGLIRFLVNAPSPQASTVDKASATVDYSKEGVCSSFYENFHRVNL